MMTEDADQKQQGNGQKPLPPSREQQLAEQMRANLKRRKSQARARKKGDAVD